MVILEVYTKNIKVRYKNTLLSKAAFLTLVTRIFSIIIPFIISYETGGFWVKHYEFFEQPKISISGDYLLIIMTRNLSNPIVCSTIPYYKTHMDHLDFCSLIKVREIDNNLDGIMDKLDLNIRLNLFNNQITSLNLILPIIFQLKTECPLQMQSAIIYHHFFHQDTTLMKVTADLDFYQSSAISCSKIVVHNTYDTPIIEYGDTSKDYELDNIIEKYMERNLSTHLKNVYTNVKTENTDVFNLKLLVRYPDIRIYFKPGLWHVLKNAWIQYFAIFIIIAGIVDKVNCYIFNKKLVLFYEDSPLKKIH